MKNTIKINRTIQGLSQDQLAKEVDVSRQTINAIENNKYFPSLELGLKLSKVLKCSVNELFSLDWTNWKAPLRPYFNLNPTPTLHPKLMYLR